MAKLRRRRKHSKRKSPGFHFCELYRESFWFMLGWPEQKALSYLRRHWNFEGDLGFPSTSGKAIEFISHDGRHAIVIWTRKKPRGTDFIGSLAHECVHAANFVLSRRKVHVTTDEDEAQAYLVELLVKKALGG